MFQSGPSPPRRWELRNRASGAKGWAGLRLVHTMLCGRVVRLLILGAVLCASLASAEENSVGSSFFERCYGGAGPANAPPQLIVSDEFLYAPQRPPLLPVRVDAQPSGGGGPPSLGGLSGSGGAYVLIAAAVIAAVALPIVVYAVDHPAPAPVLKRFYCPSFAFDGWGGAQGLSGVGWTPTATARLRLGYSHFGTEVQFDAVPRGVGALSLLAVLRPTPREHIEGGLAVGYKRTSFDGVVFEGVEVALPHEYVVWRNERRQVGIELRPGIFVNRHGVDPSVELAFRLPIVEFLSARLAGQVFTFGGEVVVGFNAGLSLHL